MIVFEFKAGPTHEALGAHRACTSLLPTRMFSHSSYRHAASGVSAAAMHARCFKPSMRMLCHSVPSKMWDCTAALALRNGTCKNAFVLAQLRRP